MNSAQKEPYRQYCKLRKQISRLYNGPTPLREIEKLYHDLEIAYQNDLHRLQEQK